MKLLERKVLLLALICCALAQTSCGDGTTGPQFPTFMTAASSISITGTAGEPALPFPSVIVTDQHVAPMAGVTVTFMVTGGGGTVNGAAAVTNSGGIATVGGWTLGPTAGSNTLSATIGQMTPVMFTASGAPGAPASIRKVAGDAQIAAAGTPVLTAPAVMVSDANGNGVPGVAVTFTVGLGGGSVTGADATSDANGVAQVGSWTLGALGTNTLVATEQGGPSATFTATAVVPCLAPPLQYTFGTTLNGSLSTLDCRLDNGSYADLYQAGVMMIGGLFRVSLTSSSFDSYLYVLGFDQSPIAKNDNASSGTQNASVRIIGTPFPASYIFWASSATSGATGSYTLSSAGVSTSVTNCEEIFITRRTSTFQNLETTDCSGSSFYDRYTIYLKAGESVTIYMSPSGFEKNLELFDPSGTSVSTSLGNTEIVYTPLQTGYYVIHAGSVMPNQTGPYILGVN